MRKSFCRLSVIESFYFWIKREIRGGSFCLFSTPPLSRPIVCNLKRVHYDSPEGDNMRCKSILLIRPATTLMLALFLLSFPAAVLAQDMGNSDQMNHAKKQVSKSSVESLTSSWPEKPREAAKKLTAKYGPPNEATDDMLIWKNNGPWKRTILYKQEISHEFPAPHTDFLQQVIDYRVPADKFDDLAKYDGSVIVERTKGELSARCDMEELNLLALNLANDVITGKRSVDEARDTYAKTAMAFKQGSPQAYTQQLQFQVAQGTADPDKPASETMTSQK
jgi:hypothetical protein